MLDAIGVASVEELFAPIPQTLRDGAALELPEALDEQRLLQHISALAQSNGTRSMKASFLGAGVYDHFIPAVVPQLLSRSEFLTAYTPYQPELAQGTLQAIFEFQTHISEVLQMEVANASMYDGAHAVAEAVLMSIRMARNPRRVLLSSAVHPEYRAVTQTYLSHSPVELLTIPTVNGRTALETLDEADLSGVSMLLIQSPNFFGVIEDLQHCAAFCKKHGILLGVCFSEALAYGILQPPGAFGADIVAGEGQSFGIPVGYGGPLVGLFATKMSNVRLMPGRLVSQSTDTLGKPSYVLTLATREQHIRRARATSNICTNQALMALAASIYLSLLGKRGFVELATINLARAEYAKKALTAIPNVSLAHQAPTFNEFVLELPRDAAQFVDFAAKEGIAAGVELGRFFSERSKQLLVTVTENNSIEQIDALAQLLRAFLAT
jgi:glycine dehydrogenase subunit 1